MKCFLLVVAFLSLLSCSNSVKTEHANFTNPLGFTKKKSSKKSTEILRAKHSDQMYIIVKDDLGGSIKKSSLGSSASMKLAHNMKFGMFKITNKGHSATESKTYKVNGRNVIEQGFEANEYVGKVYYKYYVVDVGGYFLTVIISGKLDLKTEQLKICEEFIASIEPAS